MNLKERYEHLSCPCFLSWFVPVLMIWSTRPLLQVPLFPIAIFCKPLRWNPSRVWLRPKKTILILPIFIWRHNKKTLCNEFYVKVVTWDINQPRAQGTWANDTEQMLKPKIETENATFWRRCLTRFVKHTRTLTRHTATIFRKHVCFTFLRLSGSVCEPTTLLFLQQNDSSHDIRTETDSFVEHTPKLHTRARSDKTVCQAHSTPQMRSTVCSCGVSTESCCTNPKSLQNQSSGYNLTEKFVLQASCSSWHVEWYGTVFVKPVRVSLTHMSKPVPKLLFWERLRCAKYVFFQAQHGLTVYLVPRITSKVQLTCTSTRNSNIITAK